MSGSMAQLYSESNSSVLRFGNEPVLLSMLAAVLLNLLGYSIYFCYLFIPLFILLLFDNRKLIDLNLLFLSLFSILYFLCQRINNVVIESNTVFYGYLIFPSIFYFIGRYIVSRYSDILSIHFIILFICLFFSILPFWANLQSALHNGFMQDRNIPMFWSKPGEVVSATSVGSYFACNLALLPLFLQKKDGNMERIISVVSLFLFIIALFSILNMSNRTGLVVILVSLLLYMFINEKNRLKSFITVLIIILIIVIFYKANILGFQSWFGNSLLSKRLSDTSVYEDSSRMTIWINAITALLNNPTGIGGNLFSKIGADYAHNLWLDVGLRAGFLPLLPLLIFTITGIVDFIKIILDAEIKYSLKLLLSGFGVGYYITFCLEPVLEGMHIMFFIFCLYSGLLHGIREKRSFFI